MAEEAADEGHVDIGQEQVGGLTAHPFLGEAEEQAEGVAVGGDGVWTGSPVLLKPLGEEGLEQRRQGRHGFASQNRSRRAPAASISSGVAERYQYVELGLT